MKTIDTKYYLTAAAVCLTAVAALGYYYFLTDFSRHDEPQHLYIDQDDTAETVRTKLEAIGSQHSLTGISTLLRHCNYEEHIRTGHYVVEPGERTWNVFRKLRNGQQDPVRITIPEVRTMPRLASVLSRHLMADSTDIADALCDSAFCRELGYDTATMASMFIPDTYEVFWNTPVEKLMTRLKKEHDRFWNTERRQKAAALNLTPEEVCTLASIIDEETANTQEKPMIAGMYLNRLRQNMPLQADPTVKFALGDFAARRIYQKMLTADSPYNTYKHAGLPPGPIKIASVAGIDAVLNAVAHDYLYMCAKEDFSGTHNFAATYKEHLQNAARYSKALNERGIK